MLKVAFVCPDPAAPRTVFYERFSEAVRRGGRYTDDPAAAGLWFPAEDTALETNWPRYARPATAFVRGAVDPARHMSYLERLKRPATPLCIVNMHPFLRVPTMVRAEDSIVVADVNLRAWERAANPRTIAMPALPIATGAFNPGAKRILASFRGVNSHPCRERLATIGDGRSIVVELVERSNHFGKIDAESKIFDPAYVALLDQSVFAFVPRGDAEFSYRLLEVLSFGCIPVVLSDRLILPFDRSLDWDQLAVRVPESQIAEIPAILGHFSAGRIAAMQAAVRSAYARYFATIDAIVDTLLGELEPIVAGPGPGPSRPAIRFPSPAA